MGVYDKFVIYTVAILFLIIFSPAGMAEHSICIHVNPPTCIGGGYSPPEGVELLPADINPFITPEEVTAMNAQLRQRGFIQVNTQQFWFTLEFAAGDSGLAPYFAEADYLVDAVTKQFPGAIYRNFEYIGDFSTDYFFYIDTSSALLIRKTQYKQYDSSIPLPLELVNRVVAGLPAISVTHAVSDKGNAVKRIQWATEDDLYTVELHLLKRRPAAESLLERRLLEIAHQITLSSYRSTSKLLSALDRV